MMPVGKVFNAAENQVLFSPVSNYYQGKAIRQQLAAGELDMKTKEKNLELADKRISLEEERVKLSERQVKTSEELLDLNREKFENEVGKEAASKAAFDAYSITQEVDSLFQQGGKTPEAEAASLQVAAERFGEYAETLPDGEQKAGLLEKLQDGLTADEYRSIRPATERAARYYGHVKDAENTTLAEGAMLLGPDNEPIVKNPRTFKPEKDGQDMPASKPISLPTAREDKIIKPAAERVADENGGDYGFSGAEVDKIETWLGDTAERIQRLHASRGKALGFSDAVDLAAAEADKFIMPPEDPGLFSNDTQTFAAPDQNIGEIYVGDDNVSYLVTGYNEKGKPRGIPLGN
jgi:hypothetical protein